MKRFIASFFVGALVLLVLYEASQVLGSREHEASEEDAWRMAALVHEGLAGAAAAGASDPEHLEVRLGVLVEPMTHAAYERACSQEPFVTTRGEVEVCVGAPDDEESWRVVAALPSGPIALDGAAMLEESEGETGVPFGFSLLLLFAGMGALGAVLAWSPSRQLRRLATAATALRDGDLDARAVVPRSGLVTPVAMAFNDMAAQVQKTVAWQELLLQTVAHELRTPLSRVRFIAERVSDATEDAERHDALGDLDLELTEMEALITSLLSLLSTEGEAALVSAPTDLAELLDDLLERLERRQRHRDPPLVIARVGFQLTSPLARVDQRAVSRVFDNLLANAAAHARTRVQVTVDLEEHTLLVAIEDDGEGIPGDQRSQILEPFVRLEDGRARAGTGLGLAIVRRLAEAHGHPVVVCAGDLGGLRVETRWPLGGGAGLG